MSEPRFPRRIVALGLIVWTTAAFALRRAQSSAGQADGSGSRVREVISGSTRTADHVNAPRQVMSLLDERML